MKFIKRHDLDELAAHCRLKIQADCGGFRIVQERGRSHNAYVFPEGGVCPTATKRECWIFLQGWKAGKRAFAESF